MWITLWPIATIIVATGACAGGTARAPASTAAPAPAAQPPREVQWELVWSDEFDTPGAPDAKQWSYEIGFVRNEEAQYYTEGRRENARVEDGHLVIEARREQFPNAAYEAGAKDDWQKSREHADYTSASLHTRGKGEWTYGRIEARAKVPQGRGVWPAVWTLGTNIEQAGWPLCGEIDILEFVGFDPTHAHVNVHTKAYNHTLGTNKGSKVERKDLVADFHVYAVEWFEDRIDFFFDDEKIFTFENEGKSKKEWPFDEPQYLILNLAIGGSWGGQQGIDDSIFPQRYLVDYVRVYQQ